MPNILISKRIWLCTSATPIRMLASRQHVLLDVDVLVRLYGGRLGAGDEEEPAFPAEPQFADTTADDLIEDCIEEGDEPQTPYCEVHSEKVSANAFSSLSS